MGTPGGNERVLLGSMLEDGAREERVDEAQHEHHGEALWSKVEHPQLWAGLTRAAEAMASFQAAQAQSGVRRGGPSLPTVQGGRWGGVVRQGGGHFQPAALRLSEELAQPHRVVGRELVLRHEGVEVVHHASEVRLGRSGEIGGEIDGEIDGEVGREIEGEIGPRARRACCGSRDARIEQKEPMT